MRFTLIPIGMAVFLATATTSKSQEKPDVPSSQEQTDTRVDVRALLDAGRDAKSLPSRVVVRLDAEAWKVMPVDSRERGEVNARGGDIDSHLKETWEFTSGRVHRVKIEQPKSRGGEVVYRREKTLPFDTKNLCKELLDGKIFAIEAGEGEGEPRLLVGTDFQVGARSIEILVDGKSALWAGESCAFGGLPETDARAFAALYERLALRARAAFSAKPSLSVPRDK